MQTGEQLKLRGMKLAADNRCLDLNKARYAAVLYAKRHGTVTADDVYLYLLTSGSDTDLGPAWGSVFREGFVWTGEWKPSSRPSNHARMIRVWRLKSAL